MATASQGSKSNLLEDGANSGELPWGEEEQDDTQDVSTPKKSGFGGALKDDSDTEQSSPKSIPRSKSAGVDDVDDVDSYILNNIVVNVVEFEKRIGPDGEFVAFKVETNLKPGAEESEIGREAMRQFEDGRPFAVWRRFNNFELLVSFLVFKFPYAIVPPIPEKSLNFKLTKLGADKFDTQFIEKRRVGFQHFLRRLISHPVLSNAAIVLHFLQSQNWRQFVTVRTPQGVRKKWQPNSIDDALRVFPNPRVPHRPFQEERIALEKMKENIVGVLRVHIRIANCVHNIHSSLIDFGDSMSNIVEIGSGKKIPLFDMIGQQFDSMTGTGPELLKKEEICFADRLKEYAQFSDSAKEVLDNVDVLQCKHEKAQQSCDTKRKSIEAWKNPQRASMSGFFKSFASKEMSETKVAQEETELQELETAEADLERETAVVIQAVTEELKRYNGNQVAGMKGVLLEYARMQQTYCRKNLTYWTETKLACEDIDSSIATNTYILQ